MGSCINEYGSIHEDGGGVLLKSNAVTRVLLINYPPLFSTDLNPLLSRCYPARLLSTSFYFSVILLRYSGHMMYN